MIPGGEEEQLLRGEEDGIHYVHTCERQHNETHQTLFDKAGRKEQEYLFKVHCRHLWNYHNEIPSTVNVCQLKY
jgi:hypothetical protein